MLKIERTVLLILLSEERESDATRSNEVDEIEAVLEKEPKEREEKKKKLRSQAKARTANNENYGKGMTFQPKL